MFNVLLFAWKARHGEVLLINQIFQKIDFWNFPFNFDPHILATICYQIRTI